jgi:hypothetical protein
VEVIVGKKNHKTEAPADGTTQSIAKMVPSGVIAIYTAYLAALDTAKLTWAWALPLGIVLSLVFVNQLIYQAGRNRTPAVEPSWFQYAFSSLAFLAWAFSIKDPLAAFDIVWPKELSVAGLFFLPPIGALLLENFGEVVKAK